MSPTYFLGTVLPPRVNITGQDARDKTFVFTTQEKQNLDLENVPIRCQHAAELPVGRVLRNWTTNDETSVIGVIDIDPLKTCNVKSRFAQMAISGENPIYGSLSLKHGTMVFSDGTTRKRPIEVSLCEKPRRKGSTIKYVWNPKAQSLQNQTKKNTYISAGKIDLYKMTKETEVIQEASQKNEQKTHTPEEFMRIILQQEADLEKMKVANLEKEAALAKKEEELKFIHEAKAKEEAEKLAKAQQKAAHISAALRDDLMAALPESMMTDDVIAKIDDLAKKMPEEAYAVFELCHAASEQHKKASIDFQNFKQHVDKQHTVEKFNAVLAKKRSVGEVTKIPVIESVVKHDASARQTISPAEHFQALASKYTRGDSIHATHTKYWESGGPRGRKRRKPFQ